MRIAFTAHLSEISGAGTALVSVASAFAQAGHDVWIIIPGHGDLVDRARQAGVNAVIIENPESALADAGVSAKLQMLSRRWAYVAGLRSFLIREQVDVAYVNSSASVFAGIAARLARVPVVWHVHETIEDPSRATRLKLGVIRRISDGLVYASESARKSVPSGSIPSMVARNAVDMAGLLAVRAARSRPQQNDSSAPSEPVIFANGTIKRKGADVLLSAVTLLSGQDPRLMVRVTITGSGETDPEFYTKLQQLAQSDELRGRVEFAGVQSSLSPFLQTADVFVSASRNEAMPIAVVEAMAAGVPVVATDVGDCGDLLDHGECGWVVPAEDAAALAGAIREVLSNPAEASRRAQAAARKADDLYGGEGFWDELIRFVERAASA